MIITIAEGTENEGSLTFPKWFLNGLDTSGYKIELFRFENGDTLDWQTISNNALEYNDYGNDSNEIIRGSDNVGNNISGDNSDNMIIGGNKNDILNGGNGNDVIKGGYGNDILNGGSGNDILGDRNVGSEDYIGNSLKYKEDEDSGDIYNGGNN